MVDSEFRTYAQKRIAVGILLSIVALWIVGVVLGFFDKSPSVKIAESDRAHPVATSEEADGDLTATHEALPEQAPAAHTEQAPVSAVHSGESPTVEHTTSVKARHEDSLPAAKDAKTHTQPSLAHQVLASESAMRQTRGAAFVTACIEPLDYELNHRFYGWRPNDAANFTDNVNNFQLGVLEVTRRTAVNLAERISRTGSTASFDIHLERAMNYFMIKADRYWFPSAEAKYKDGLNEIKTYLKRLEKKEASFYTRADNLIPLLASYEDLLGSCDEHLVKAHEEDGSPVSIFKSDDYFYYAQGVASAMATVLEAVLQDFHDTIESRHGTEILHHAIESCHRAKEIHPWIITESSLSGILANHRANMAAPISHAKFYLGVLIKTLST